MATQETTDAATQPRLLHIEHVMAQLAVSRSTVFELLGTGQLRSVKIGARRLIPQTAVDEFIAHLLDCGHSVTRKAAVAARIAELDRSAT